MENRFLWIYMLQLCVKFPFFMRADLFNASEKLEWKSRLKNEFQSKWLYLPKAKTAKNKQTQPSSYYTFQYQIAFYELIIHAFYILYNYLILVVIGRTSLRWN